MTLLVVLLAIAVGVLTLLVFGLLRTHAEILRALDRAGISLSDTAAATATPLASQASGSVSTHASQVHDLVGSVPGGGPAKIVVSGVEHFTLLAFLSPGCRTCKRFWEAFAVPDLDLPGTNTRLVIVGQDPVHDSESALAGLVPLRVKAMLSSAAWQQYDVPGSPYFVLIDGTGNRVVGAGSAMSWPQLRDLLNQALDDSGLADTSGQVPSNAQRFKRSHSGRNRNARADQALQSAGIGPGHSSLYGTYPADQEQQ